MRHRLPMYERVRKRLESRSDVDQMTTSSVDGFRVFEYGPLAFEGILERAAQAERSIEMRAFLWRDDEAGERLGRALLDAAERGVQVTIQKDRIAAVYEYSAGSKQSFFHKHKKPRQGITAWFLSKALRTAGSAKQRPNPLAKAIVEHPNITVHHEANRYDHAKLFVFDDQYITIGSMGIGDNHLHEWLDFVVELEGREHVERLRQRVAGEVDFDPGRDIDFLVHDRQTTKKRHCPMLDQRLALLEAARHSITIEMAYLGDKRFTRALIRALDRGVHITMVIAAQADVLGNVNRAVCNTLLRRAGSKNLTVFLLPRMVHSKVMVIDHKICDIGSANFTPLSHGVYNEINLYAVNTAMAREVERVIMLHTEEGVEAGPRLGYGRFSIGVERAVLTYHSRGTARLGRSQLSRAEILAIKREDRAISRQAKREGKQFKREQRQTRKQERISVKNELRRDKRKRREDKKFQRVEAKRSAREARRSVQEEKRESRAARRSRREDRRRMRELRRVERLQAKRALRRTKREQRIAKRKQGNGEPEQPASPGRRSKNAQKIQRLRGRSGTNRSVDRP